MTNVQGTPVVIRMLAFFLFLTSVPNCTNIEEGKKKLHKGGLKSLYTSFVVHRCLPITPPPFPPGLQLSWVQTKSDCSLQRTWNKRGTCRTVRQDWCIGWTWRRLYLPWHLVVLQWISGGHHQGHFYPNTLQQKPPLWAVPFAHWYTVNWVNLAWCGFTLVFIMFASVAFGFLDPCGFFLPFFFMCSDFVISFKCKNWIYIYNTCKYTYVYSIVMVTAQGLSEIYW